MTVALSGGLMVCGTASDAGKTTVVTGLCRLLARRGVRVAPFKAQNMALNSAVTPDGHEIGRAQAAQAQAAGVAPEVAMNPILLKPQSDRTSQVVVMGRPWATLDAAAYHEAKPALADLVLDQLAGLRRRFDVVLCEGAGSPAEVNLLPADIVNLAVARASGLAALIVGDIDRGGVFAAMFGTVGLLPDDLRRTVKGFVINKFRGDPALLAGGPAELERRTGIPTLGVLPWMEGLGIDGEDSLGLARDWRRPSGPGNPADALDVAVIRLPHISNFTDVDALAVEPSVALRLVDSCAALGRPDLLVIPGSKATVADLEWLRRQGLADGVAALARNGRTTVLGLCGGYQMLGRSVEDEGGVEARQRGTVEGLGLLAVDTRFHAQKITRWSSGTALGQPVRGYEIRHGRTESHRPWIAPGEGACSADGRVAGTSWHGVFEADGFRDAFLAAVAARAGKPWAPSGVSYEAARQDRFDRLADAIEAHLDVAAIESLIAATEVAPA